MEAHNSKLQLQLPLFIQKESGLLSGSLWIQAGANACEAESLRLALIASRRLQVAGEEKLSEKVLGKMKIDGPIHVAAGEAAELAFELPFRDRKPGKGDSQLPGIGNKLDRLQEFLHTEATSYRIEAVLKEAASGDEFSTSCEIRMISGG
jgi:hypothetical protein